jgi:DnaK suppressor protein
MARQPAKLSASRLRALRAALEAERVQLRGQVLELDDAADAKNWRESGFDDDPADAGSASFERETAQSLSLHARGLLTQIEDALRRMDEDTYGVCTGCDRRIDFERLEALPYAVQCAECRRREESGR